MHELAVTQSILEIAERHAQTHHVQSITDLYLVLGEWSSIVDDSVQFYWDIISQNTLAEGATLHFRRVPIRLLCLGCDNQYSPNADDLVCPQCGGRNVKVIHGEEFYLEAIDVESGEKVHA